MADCPENPLFANCKKCQRQGFTWARGYCQYCGHRQYDDALFASERIDREQLNAEAIEAYKLACKQRRKGSSGDSSGGGGYLGDFGDGGDFWDFGGDGGDFDGGD